MAGFNIRNEETYDNLGVTNDTNSKTIGTDLLSLIPSDIPTTDVSDGTIIYDKAANEFKGYINGSWQTITSGGSLPVVSANDKEVLFNNTSANELQGSSELQWDNAESKLTIGSGSANDSYLVLTPKVGAAPAGAPDGAIKYFSGDLQFKKAGTWTSLTQVGSASNAAGNAQNIQFNGGNGVFGGDSDFNFWPQGTPLPGSNPPFPLPNNIVDIGDIFGIPTGKTNFVYRSDVNNNTYVQFDDTSGINIELSKTASSQGNDSFYVKSNAQGISQSADLQNKIRLETVDGETHLYSFRRTNGSDYGEGNIKLSTNTGEIRLETLGENSGSGVPLGPNGGTINVIGNDADINLETTTQGTNNRKIKLSCLGSRSGLNDEGIRLETIRQPSGAGSTSSNNIELSTVGGDVKIETTGVGGSANTGKISLNSGTTNSIDLEAGQNINIDGGQDINIASTTGDVNLSGSSIKAKSKFEVQTSASATTIELDGSSDGVVTVGTNSNDNGNIKIKNTKSGTGSGVGYAVRVGSDSTNQSGRIQITNNSDQVTMDINGGNATGNSQPYIILRDYIGSSGKELFIRSMNNNRGCIEGNTNNLTTMIIDSNGGSSVGSAVHGQMIFTSSGSTSGSIPVMKIERSDFSDDATPTLQLERPLRLWNATTSNITNTTKGLTQPGDLGYDITEDCIKYTTNNGSVRPLSSEQRILRVVQGSQSLAKNYNSTGIGTSSWSGVTLPAPAYGGSGSGPVPLGPAGPPSIIGTIRSGTTFTNASQSGSGTPAIQSAPGLGSEDCNIIYFGTAGQPGTGNIIPADGTPNFRPVLCCKCRVPERISANPTDLEYSLLVSGNLNIWAHKSSSTSGSDRISFSLGVFATLADSIGVPNGGVAAGTSNSERRNNPYTGPPNTGGAAGTAYNSNYISIIGGSDTTINGNGGGMGGLGTWPRPIHSSYYTNLTQTGNNGPTSGTGDALRYASVGTFTNGTWTDPLGFAPGTPATGGGWGDALKGDSYQDTPQEAQGTPRSGTMSVPFNLLCNNPNLDFQGGTWSKGPEREIYIWLCLGFNAGGNWDWLQVSKNGFGNQASASSSGSPYFGANSMKVTYLGGISAISNATSDA